MHGQHYELTLSIPGKADSQEMRFRIITDERVATTRADVHQGHMVMIDSGQWFLLNPDSVVDSKGEILVLRTQRSPREYERTKVYNGSALIVHPAGPYAQSLVKALYFFGFMTDLSRRKTLEQMQDDWVKEQVVRVKRVAKDNVLDALQAGELSVEDVKSVLQAYQNSSSTGEEPEGSDDTFALKA